MEDRRRDQEAGARRFGFYPAQFAEGFAGDDWETAQRAGRLERNLQALSQPRYSGLRALWCDRINRRIWIKGRLPGPLQRLGWSRQELESAGGAPGQPGHVEGTGDRASASGSEDGAGGDSGRASEENCGGRQRAAEEARG